MENRIIDLICNNINRKISTMDYEKETKVREYLKDELFNIESDSNFIAEILEVNEFCVYDLFVNMGLLLPQESETDSEVDEELANKRLIASAPELLSNLQAMVQAFEEYAEIAQFKSGIFMAKQAIEKATKG